MLSVLKGLGCHRGSTASCPNRPRTDPGVPLFEHRALQKYSFPRRASRQRNHRADRSSWPHADAWPFIEALVDAFTLDRCLWASDWPYLRAPTRVDYGVVLNLVLRLFPNASERRKLLKCHQVVVPKLK